MSLDIQNTRYLGILLGAMTVLFAVSNRGSATPIAGQVDENFGTNGQLKIQPPADWKALGRYEVVKGPDQDFYVAIPIKQKHRPQNKGIFVTHFNRDGLLDPEFGTGNGALIDIDDDYYFQLVDIQLQGRRLIIQYITSWSGGVPNYKYVRLNEAGGLEQTLPITDIGGFRVLDSGRIVTYSREDRSGEALIVVRAYTKEGKPDDLYGLNGVTTVVIGDTQDRFGGIVLSEALADGSLIVSSTIHGSCATTSPTPCQSFVVVKLNSAGSLDHTFGEQGLTFPEISHRATARYLVSTGDGGLLIAGEIGSFTNPASEHFLAKIRPDGTLDEEFGTNGVMPLNTTGGGTYVTSVPQPHLMSNGDWLLLSHGASRSWHFFRAQSLQNTFSTFGDDIYPGHSYLLPQNRLLLFLTPEIPTGETYNEIEARRYR